MIGPVFFSLIQTSITKGKTAGVWMAAGISVSDAAYIALALLGISQIPSGSEFSRFSGLAGGVLLAVFGLGSLFKKGVKTNVSVEETKAYKLTWWWLMLKGLLLNTLNPFTLFFWIGAVVAHTSGGESAVQTILFFAATIITVFATDLTKVYLADKLSAYITARLLTLLNRLTGIALIAFSLKLFYFFFTGGSLM